ncbi:uncharacterized protein LOC117167839 [Belonocnema kinseyi]|uniref:uncharacterized protein LOC117167839 n=1 Tax=Belonocnema kinseyi TaxID=2817044 RepID=UPI00143DED9F|nr:uncharacterized protein LOC117167839 [Belonocnema kinseyi]
MGERRPYPWDVAGLLSHGRQSLGLQPPGPAPAPAELIEEVDEESLRLMVGFTDAILEFADEKPSTRNGCRIERRDTASVLATEYELDAGVDSCILRCDRVRQDFEHKTEKPGY